MAYEPQHPQLVKEVVLSRNKQNTFGTALGDAALTYRARPDISAWARIAKEFWSDIERAGKGHPWPTQRVEIARDTGFSIGGDLDTELAGIALMSIFHKVATSGVGPFTHLFTYELATRIAPVTTIYFADTADIKYKMQDLVGISLTISGSDRGPLQFQLELMGSGRHLDGAIGALPALAAQTLLLGSDTDILLGAPGASASIKERIRSWSAQFVSGAAHHRAPGGGKFSSFAKIGLQRATVQLGIAAKNVDDIRTLNLNDTLQELKINTNSGASAQLNIEFPNLHFRAPQLAVDGIEQVWNVTAEEQDVLKAAALDYVKATVINGLSTYLVGA